MTYLHVIVPTRGRPRIVSEMTEAFRATCEPKPYNRQTRLTFAVDDDDPARPEYEAAIAAVPSATNMVDWGQRGTPQVPVSPDMVIVGNLTEDEGTGMVGALNSVAMRIICRSINPNKPAGIAFMGDDHRPEGNWDTAICQELDRLGIGLVYGDDGIQGPNLPTAVAISTEIVCTLGYMAPPGLRHLYVDNAWLSLGRMAQCMTYLPHVKIRHMHPVAGLANWDEGYVRCNSREIDQHDKAEYERWLREEATLAAGKIDQLRQPT